MDCEVEVVEANDYKSSMSIDFDAFVLSPGPGLPEESLGMDRLIKDVLGKKPIFGVCLGMQAIGLHLNGELFNQEVVKHGVQESIQIKRGVIFEKMKPQIDVGLYHSWALKNGVGDFSISAVSSNGTIMAIENPAMKVYGVQFHPESILTPDGKQILENFLATI